MTNQSLCETGQSTLFTPIPAESTSFLDHSTTGESRPSRSWAPRANGLESKITHYVSQLQHLRNDRFEVVFYISLSAFRPRGVPGPTSKLSPRVPAQMGRRETEHEGGTKEGDRQKGKPAAFVLSCAQVWCACSRGLQASAWEGEREQEAYTRRPVLPRGQPSRKRALDLPFIGVRRGSRCTMGV
jgi:hypothetical protein